MLKPLSFSGYKRFITCPKFYEYHDVLGEKSDIMSSALVFGSAIDIGLNHLLENKDCPASVGRAITIAQDYINANKIDYYYSADYDNDFGLENLQNLLADKKYDGDPNELMTNILANQTELSENESFVLNAVLKHCLVQKATVIIQSYAEKVLPIIDKVETVQYEHTTPCGSKRGIIDTVIILKDGRRVIFDNKTASRPYDKDATLKSPQLALYAEFVKAEYAGFIVMNKQITKNRIKVCSKCKYDGTGTKFKSCNNVIKNKKCGSEWDEKINPSAFIQIHVDKIPDINKNLIVEAMDDTIKCINNGVFPKNLNNCFSMYGAKCPYIQKCWKIK